MAVERADKLLANSGRWSRRELRTLFREGRVRLAGRVLRDGAEKLAPDAPLVVDGLPVATQALHYLMLHKPRGLVSSTEDPRERTVLELLPEELRRCGLFPVGRLDKDTEGLLLLSNDGPLAHRLLSPRQHVRKCYYAEVDGLLEEADVRAFCAGIALRDGTRCLPAGLTILPPGNRAEVSVEEGKYHQVKRMLASRGAPVRYLKRLSMGSLKLDPALALGEFRPLSTEELQKLGL